MHWADINAAIYKAGTSPSRIATQEETTNSFVARVIRGQQSSYRIATAISAVTNIPMNRLWPGRYNQAPRQALARRVA
jgi:lambda repressor-like predicted transcriptional regulator